MITEDVNLATFEQIQKRLEQEYPHQVVAICEGEIVGIGTSYREALLEAIRKEGNKNIFIHRIGPYDKDAVSLF